MSYSLGTVADYNVPINCVIYCQVLNVMNVLVIVTRWYGGCHLGPDRFKHINTATRCILEQCGLLGGQHQQQTMTASDATAAGAAATSSVTSKKMKQKVK